jgi:hypothetical protein
MCCDVGENLYLAGAPGRIRTRDPLLRSHFYCSILFLARRPPCVYSQLEAIQLRSVNTVQYRPLTPCPRSNDGQMIKVVVMGFSRKRIGRDGKPRYTAYYLDIREQSGPRAPSPARRLQTRPGRTRRRRSGQASRATLPAAGRPSKTTSWGSGFPTISWNPAYAGTTPARSTTT